MQSINSGISALDRAYGFRQAGKPEDAARMALSVFETSKTDLDAALLLAELLVDEKRIFVASEALARIADGFVRRGDLPSAIVAAKLVARADEDPLAVETAIAKAFGKGSPRVGDGSASPPPLPKAPSVAPELKSLAGEALWGRVENALEGLLSSNDPLPADGKVPRYPLFGDLEPAELRTLVAALVVRDVAADQTIVKQDDVGSEAFVVVRGMAKVVKKVGGEQHVLAALGPGSLFGEMSLVSDAPRAASVVAVEGVRLLVVSRAELERLAVATPAIGERLGEFCHQRMVANLLRTSPVFSNIDPAQRADLMGRFQSTTFEPGNVLITQGEPPSSMFVIASGAVDISTVDADGENMHLARLGPGDVVGEISLVLRKPATAHAVASHPTVALELTREAFDGAIASHPALLGQLYQLAVSRDDQTRSVMAQATMEAGDFDVIV